MLVAVDIGNNRLKCGVFAAATNRASVPQPLETFAAADPSQAVGFVSRVMAAQGSGPSDASPSWWIASVNQPLTSELLECLKRQRPADKVVLASAADVPLTVELPHPDRVGIDRLMNALAAERMRTPARPAVIVDLGTAITIDPISVEGAFLGGAILPGLATAARALHQFTDMLPWLPVEDLTPPQPIGKNTEAAMRAGLFWGTLGAIRELIAQQAIALQGQPDVFVTGGHGAIFAEYLPSARCVPHLTLIGIAMAAGHCESPA